MTTGGTIHSVVRDALLDLLTVLLKSFGDCGFLGESIDRPTMISI